jgi:hypothetical protein
MGIFSVDMDTDRDKWRQETVTHRLDLRIVVHSIDIRRWNVEICKSIGLERAAKLQSYASSETRGHSTDPQFTQNSTLHVWVYVSCFDLHITIIDILCYDCINPADQYS